MSKKKRKKVCNCSQAISPASSHTDFSILEEGNTESPRMPIGMPGQRFFLKPKIFDTTPWVKKVVSGRFTRSGNPDLAILCWETGGRCVVDGVSYGKGFLVKPFINVSRPGDLGATFIPSPKLEYIDDSYRFFDMYPNDIAIGDINGDGLDDIVVANCHSDHLFVYISRGDGTFNVPIIITDTGADDPCYVALGNFSGSGNVDIALLHTSRVHPAPGKNLAWTFSLLFGNGDGTFQAPITQDLGRWSVPDSEDGGMYYHSGHFNFFTMKSSVQVSGVYRDAVAMGTVMRWWDGTNIVGPDHPAKFFKTSLGQHTTQLYNPPHADLAVLGGRATKTSIASPADLLMTITKSTDNLDKAWLAHSGYGITTECSGVHMIAEDFDNDGVVDILLFNDILDEVDYPAISPDKNFFIAYGKNKITNPLDLATISPEFDRLKYFEGPAGGWERGHRPWRTTVADFDLDGFLDIVHSTEAGLVLFTNAGLHTVQSIPPRILQYHVEPAHTPPDPWYEDRLVIQVQIFDDRKVVAAVFRPVTDLTKGHVLLMLNSTDTRGTVIIPDEDDLPVGSYKLSVFNGVEESANSVDIKIALRPITVNSVRLLGVSKHEANDRLEVLGFFGTDKDHSLTTFKLQKKIMPVPAPITLGVSSRDKQKAVCSVPITSEPGLYDLIVQHPKRGIVTVPVTIPDYSPKLIFVHWNNKDGTWGEYDKMKTPPFIGQPMKAGARVEVHGSMFYAPDTTNWELLDKAGAVFANSTGFTTDLAFDINSNSKGAFIFFPTTLADAGKDLQLRLTTKAGLKSDLIGPLSTGKIDESPTDPEWWIGVEYMDGGITGYCGYHSFRAKEYDQSDAMKPPGALQKAKMLFPGNYLFTKLSGAAEATIGLCYVRHWEIEAERSDGTTYADVETAITEERAKVDFNDLNAPDKILSIKKRVGDP